MNNAGRTKTADDYTSVSLVCNFCCSFPGRDKIFTCFPKTSKLAVVHMNIQYVMYNNGCEDSEPKCVSQNS